MWTEQQLIEIDRTDELQIAPRRADGTLASPRIVWATGHYRAGVLLAPVTADLVVGELAGEPTDHAFGPERFDHPAVASPGVGTPA